MLVSWRNGVEKTMYLVSEGKKKKDLTLKMFCFFDLAASYMGLLSCAGEDS